MRQQVKTAAVLVPFECFLTSVFRKRTEHLYDNTIPILPDCIQRGLLWFQCRLLSWRAREHTRKRARPARLPIAVPHPNQLPAEVLPHASTYHYRVNEVILLLLFGSSHHCLPGRGYTLLHCIFQSSAVTCQRILKLRLGYRVTQRRNHHPYGA